MKVINTTLVLASVLAFSSAYAAESAQLQQPSADTSVHSQSVHQQTEVQKDSKGAIKRKKSTVEEQNMQQQQQQAVPSTQQPAAGQ